MLGRHHGGPGPCARRRQLSRPIRQLPTPTTTYLHGCRSGNRGRLVHWSFKAEPTTLSVCRPTIPSSSESARTVHCATAFGDFSRTGANGTSARVSPSRTPRGGTTDRDTLGEEPPTTRTASGGDHRQQQPECHLNAMAPRDAGRGSAAGSTPRVPTPRAGTGGGAPWHPADAPPVDKVRPPVRRGERSGRAGCSGGRPESYRPQRRLQRRLQRRPRSPDRAPARHRSQWAHALGRTGWTPAAHGRPCASR